MLICNLERRGRVAYTSLRTLVVSGDVYRDKESLQEIPQQCQADAHS